MWPPLYAIECLVDSLNSVVAASFRFRYPGDLLVLLIGVQNSLKANRPAGLGAILEAKLKTMRISLSIKLSKIFRSLDSSILNIIVQY